MSLRSIGCVVAAVLILMGSSVYAGQGQTAAAAGAVHSVEITPAETNARAGDSVKFTAVARTEDGKVLDLKPTAWFAQPFDVAVADESGTVTLYGAGEVRVGATIGGKPGFATVHVSPAAPGRILIAPPQFPLPAGGQLVLHADVRTPVGNPLTSAAVSWRSDTPAVATVDAAGVVTGVAPGTAVIRASSEDSRGSVSVTVVPSLVSKVTVDAPAIEARTGDVIHFTAKAFDDKGAPIRDAAVRWTVSGEGATVYEDGAFVAERPGSFVVTAVSSNTGGSASILVKPRVFDKVLEVVGRGPLEKYEPEELWVVGNYAYMTSYGPGELWVYDISNPSSPFKVDSLTVDARLINDVSTTPDGRIGVISREGASDRKNGIVFLDLADPAHPRIASHFTEGVTGGVHSAFIDGHYVYATDDATGSLRIIDFADLKAPREVARWEAPNASVRTYELDGQPRAAGRILHDVQVKDGLAYLAYWHDGLVILDVGKGLKGGSPANPQLVSQFRFNHQELYEPGWVAGSHAVFRYENYVFVGDEVWPALFDLEDRRARIAPGGMFHVIDVSDIEHPRKVAEYAVPEAGAHNLWVEDGILYAGYFHGGGRVLDVSGELRGDLYRQGREIARLWTGDPRGVRPNMPFTWGAQPYKGLIYFNDINTGLWIARLVDRAGPPPSTSTRQ